MVAANTRYRDIPLPEEMISSLDETSSASSTDVVSGGSIQPFCSSGLDLARASLERKIQAGHIVNYHGANQMYLNACILANKMNLSDAQKAGITPFPPQPASNVTIVDNTISRDLVEIIGRMVPRPTTTPTPSGTSTTQVDVPPSSNVVPTQEAVRPIRFDVTPISMPEVQASPLSTDVTAEPETVETTDWWSWIKSHPWVWALLLLLLLLGAGGLYYWNHNHTTTTTTTNPPVTEDKDITGKIGVTIE